MNKQRPCLKVARVTLELVSPLSIGSGEYDAVADQPLIRDGNDLPAIPGSGLAGALQRFIPSDRVSAIFGHAIVDNANVERTGRSPFEITWGHIHDANNRPVDGAREKSALQKDAILAPLLSATFPLRDQVKINQYGTVDGAGKFDRCMISAGHRFTLQVLLWSTDGQPDDWELIYQAFKHPLFRLGGGKRSGLGAVRLERWLEANFDLRNIDDRARYARFAHCSRLDQSPQGLEEKKELLEKCVEFAPSLRRTIFKMNLRFNDYWRIGQGNLPLDENATGKPADLLPLTMDTDKRAKDEGNLERRNSLPYISLKYGLRHRTEYFLRCMQLSGEVPQSTEEEDVIANLAKTLFGNTEQIGSLTGNDLFLPIGQHQIIAHNAIDHFTQGVRNGALFFEEMVFQHTLDFQLDQTPGANEQVIRAFEMALEDLCEGRLALGASSARGHGYLQGKYDMELTPYV